MVQDVSSMRAMSPHLSIVILTSKRSMMTRLIADLEAKDRE